MTEKDDRTLSGYNGVVTDKVRRGDCEGAAPSLARALKLLRSIEEHDARWHWWRTRFWQHQVDVHVPGPGDGQGELAL